jgi:hypothetical protein
MNNKIIKTAFIISILAINFLACKKDPKEAPKPDEQELITTLKIQLTEPLSSFVQNFEYKVENGFSSGTMGSIKIDTIKLKPETIYDAVLVVLNEKADPVENITTEIIEKGYEHLFLHTSSPVTGAGSILASNGNKDKNGAPLNQTFKLTTGTSGSGKFQITLLHQPNNKNGTTTEAAGGETDLDAIFPVILQ